MCPEMPSEGDAGDRMLVGRCQCGAVRYRVVDMFLYAYPVKRSRSVLISIAAHSVQTVLFTTLLLTLVV